MVVKVGYPFDELVVVGVEVAVGVPPVAPGEPAKLSSAALTAGNHLFAILVSPLSLGWMPSLLSELALNPVHWSTTVIGESAVDLVGAHWSMALLSWVVVEVMEAGIIFAT